MRFPITMFAIVVVSFGAGYAVFRTRTSDAVAAVIEVAGWRVQSAVSVDEDRREPEQKLNDLMALAAKPSSLARDRALYATISAMSAQDFRALGADPLAIAARFEKLSRDLQTMLAEALMDRWLEIDTDGALAWVKAARLVAESALKPNQSFQGGNAAFEGMLRVLAYRQPDWLLERARETTPKLGRASAIGCAIMTLAANNPAEAQRQLATLDQESDRRAATSGLIGGWASVDPMAAATFALSLTDAGTRSNGTLQALYSAADKGNAAMTQIFQLLPEDLRQYKWSGFSVLALTRPPAARQLMEELVSQQQLAVGNPNEVNGVANNLGRNDPVATAKWIDSWSEEMLIAVGPNFRLQFVQGWADSNPAAALEWAIAQSQSANAFTEDLIRYPLGQWLSDDQSAASAWIEALPHGELRDRANQARAEYLFHDGDSAGAARSYSAAGAADARGELAQRLASAFANKDVSAAAAWSLTLPAGVGRSSAIKSIATAWLEKDTSAAEAWFEQLPTSSDRDAGASALAVATIHDNAGVAMAWVSQITDPKARADAATTVFGTWAWTDPQGARAWLRSLNGVDEHWKQTFLRRAR